LNQAARLFATGVPEPRGSAGLFFKGTSLFTQHLFIEALLRHVHYFQLVGDPEATRSADR
jgi:hypothetical protein